jgi:hypothetical protein
MHERKIKRPAKRLLVLASVLATSIIMSANAATSKPEGYIDVFGLPAWMEKVACPNRFDATALKEAYPLRMRELFTSWHIPTTQKFTDYQKMQILNLGDQVVKEYHCVSYGD